MQIHQPLLQLKCLGWMVLVSHRVIELVWIRAPKSLPMMRMTAPTEVQILKCYEHIWTHQNTQILRLFRPGILILTPGSAARSPASHPLVPLSPWPPRGVQVPTAPRRQKRRHGIGRWLGCPLGLVHITQIRDGFVESVEDELSVGQEDGDGIWWNGFRVDNSGFERKNENRIKQSLKCLSKTVWSNSRISIGCNDSFQSQSSESAGNLKDGAPLNSIWSRWKFGWSLWMWTVGRWVCPWSSQSETRSFKPSGERFPFGWVANVCVVFSSFTSSIFIPWYCFIYFLNIYTGHGGSCIICWVFTKASVS